MTSFEKLYIKIWIKVQKFEKCTLKFENYERLVLKIA